MYLKISNVPFSTSSSDYQFQCFICFSALFIFIAGKRFPMSNHKFTCKNYTLVLSLFTGVVENGLFPLFLLLPVKCWLCLYDQVLSPRAACTGWLCPDWRQPPLFVAFGSPGRPPTWTNIVQPLSVVAPAAVTTQRQHRASITWDPEDNYVLLCMCHAEWQNLLPCKMAFALYYPKVLELISFSWFVYKGTSVNIA